MCDPLAQLVEQFPFKEWALGSNPRRVTTLGRLAQLVERYPYKVDVTSSSLVATTINRTRNEQSSSSATLTLSFLQQNAHKTSFVLLNFTMYICGGSSVG